MKGQKADSPITEKTGGIGPPAANEKEKEMATEATETTTAEFAEEAQTMGDAQPAAATPEDAKPEWVNLTMKGAFLREAKNKEGEAFYDVSIPQGTKVGGAIDVGGYHFTVSDSRVHDSKYDPNGVRIGLIKDKPLKLQKDVRQEDGSYLTTVREVQPENLRVALNNQYREYKAGKAAGREAVQTEKAVDKAQDATLSKDQTPSKDQKSAAKSAAARAKNPAKATARQASR